MPIATAPINILLVEDNPADVRLTIEAFKEASVRSNLQVARDGVEATALLRDALAREHGLPDLILLDLNLPRKDGREVLADVKRDAALRHIPVVVLSTSQSEEDVQRSYELGANAVITKPVDLDQFFHVVGSIEHFWLEMAKLPRS